MGIISAIKSLLGLEETSRSVGGTDVTVEREPTTSTERTEEGSEIADSVTSESAAVETDHSDSTTGAQSGDVEVEATGVEGDPVDSIKGIGSTYADRLAEAGVQTVDDLAEASAADLDEATGIGEGRIESWIERAQSR